jgi:hypothetical protein
MMHGSMLWQELPDVLLEGERASTSRCFSFIDMRGRSGKPVAIGGRVASFRAMERRGEVLGAICSILVCNVGRDFYTFEPAEREVLDSRRGSG